MAAITSELGQQQFMQLLIAQLKNQDPMDPVSQEDSIAQLAQFSTLEGIEKLNANFSSFMKLQSLSQGANLVGKNVEWLDPDGVRQQGVVESVSVKDGELQLEVDGKQVPIENVTAILNG
jgi:flagellar basal-body rod modification protein FlgD